MGGYYPSEFRMTKKTSQEILQGLVDSYLTGTVSFVSFQEAYSRHFIDEMPDSALSSRELDRFGAVHEKVEWTAPAPSAEERAFGWMDEAGFIAWLHEWRAQTGTSA
jgi:hypothetical protein